MESSSETNIVFQPGCGKDGVMVQCHSFIKVKIVFLTFAKISVIVHNIICCKVVCIMMEYS